jgi:hypothetical protein
MDYLWGATEYVSVAVSGAVSYVWAPEEKFDIVKLMRQLETCKMRMNLLKNKKVGNIKMERNNVAQLLRENNNEAVRIKVEAIIHDEYLIEAMDLIVPLLDVLKTRRYSIEQMTDCSFDILEPVTTIIFAAKYIEVEEFQEMRRQFELKYGKVFVDKANNDADHSVNERIKFKLTIAKPDPMLVLMYIRQIAQEHGITLEEEEEETPKVVAPLYPEASAPIAYVDIPYVPQTYANLQPVYYGEPIEMSPERAQISPNYAYPDQWHQQEPFNVETLSSVHETNNNHRQLTEQDNILDDLERRLTKVKFDSSNKNLEPISLHPHIEQDLHDIGGWEGDLLDDELLTVSRSSAPVQSPKIHFDDLIDDAAHNEETDTPLNVAKKLRSSENLSKAAEEVSIQAPKFDEAIFPEEEIQPFEQKDTTFDQTRQQTDHLDNLLDRLSAIESPQECEPLHGQHDLQRNDDLFDSLQRKPYEDSPMNVAQPKQNIDSLFDTLLNKHIDDDE